MQILHAVPISRRLKRQRESAHLFVVVLHELPADSNALDRFNFVCDWIVDSVPNQGIHLFLTVYLGRGYRDARCFVRRVLSEDPRRADLVLPVPQHSVRRIGRRMCGITCWYASREILKE